MEGAVVAKSSVKNTTKARLDGIVVELAVEMSLVEESDHFVARLPLGDSGADGDYLTRSIGAGDDGKSLREGVFTLKMPSKLA